MEAGRGHRFSRKVGIWTRQYRFVEGGNLDINIDGEYRERKSKARFQLELVGTESRPDNCSRVRVGSRP